MKCEFIGLSVLILLSGAQVLAQDEMTSAIDSESEGVAQLADEDLQPAIDTRSASFEELEPAVSSELLTAQAGAVVMDELDLGASEITGNQELPKVLYIVPWRQSDPGDLTGRPANSLLDDVLAPVDRSEFIREVDYYSDLFGEAEPK